MKISGPADYRSMPWKNGAGTTIEIAVVPPDAQLDDFAWRVSRAQVVADGAFSHFAGIDRSLALLQGEGMRLRIGASLLQVDRHHNIVSFAGDVAVHAELLDGPISDFNLMSRRAVCRHQLQHWVGALSQAIPADAVLLYCAQGGGTLEVDGSRHILQAEQTVQFDAADRSAAIVLHGDDHSRFYCVQIHR